MPVYSLDGIAPELPDDAAYWVAPDAHVIGAIHLARDVGIWFGAVLRGDNEPITIGEGTNIQEGAMLHSDPHAPLSVGEDCTIGHHAILHGCKIGDRVLIGMGATVLNNAVIPDDCIVGANALVTENKTFEPGSLIVGSPARAIRQLDDRAVAMLKASAAHYAEKARRYRAGLERID